PNLRADKAAEALQFHRSIEEGVKADHAGSSYTLLPMVGTGQPTLQSGVLNGGGLTTSEDPPPKFDRLWSHGDGTVPYVSAIPIEMSTELRLGYVCEQHGSIQNNYRVLDYLYDFLRRTQTPDLTAVRFEAKQEKGEAARPGLSVAVDDYYEPDETPVLSVSLVGNEERATRVQARVEAAGMGDNPGTLEFAPVGEGWELAIPCLRPGVYRAHIRASMGDGSSASPVTGIFEVGG